MCAPPVVFYARQIHSNAVGIMCKAPGVCFIIQLPLVVLPPLYRGERACVCEMWTFFYWSNNRRRKTRGESENQFNARRIPVWLYNLTGNREGFEREAKWQLERAKKSGRLKGENRKNGEVLGESRGRSIVPTPHTPLTPSSCSSSIHEKERGRTNASQGSFLLVTLRSAGLCLPPPPHPVPSSPHTHTHTQAHTHTHTYTFSPVPLLSPTIPHWHSATQIPLPLSHPRPPHPLLPICDKLSDSSSPSDCRL